MRNKYPASTLKCVQHGSPREYVKRRSPNYSQPLLSQPISLVLPGNPSQTLVLRFSLGHVTKSFQKSWDPSLPLESVVAQKENPRGGLYEHGEGQDWPVDSRARELWKHSREHLQERLEGRPSSQPVCPKSQSEGIGGGGNGLSHGRGGGCVGS